MSALEQARDQRTPDIPGSASNKNVARDHSYPSFRLFLRVQSLFRIHHRTLRIAKSPCLAATSDNRDIAYRAVPGTELRESRYCLPGSAWHRNLRIAKSQCLAPNSENRDIAYRAVPGIELRESPNR